MSDKKLAIKLSTLEAIGDAVRGKEGSTEPIPVNALAERILALPTPSGKNKLAQIAEGTLTEITADDLAGVTSIRDDAFYNLNSIITLTIPDSVQTIGYGTFKYCTNLISATIGNGTTNVSREMFSQCSKLANVIIGNNVTEIEQGAFNGCEALTRLTIPANVKRILTDALAMGTTTKKATVIFLSEKPPTIDYQSFGYNELKLEKIIVPKGCGDVYKSATNWANVARFIEEATE